MGGDPPTLHGAAPEPDGSLCALPRSFDNSQICSCGSDKAVVLWDVASGQVVRKYRGHAGVSMEGGRGCGGARWGERVKRIGWEGGGGGGEVATRI